MTDKAEFERLLDVYGFRCERFGQDLSTHARAQVVSAFAALASAPVAGEAQPVGRVRHFTYSGIARNGFSQEAVLNDDAPSLPDGTLLYAAPQASAEDVIPASGHVCNEALEEAAQAAYNELFPTNDRSDWTEFAEHSAQHAAWAAQSIRALKQPQADKDGGTHG